MIQEVVLKQSPTTNIKVVHPQHGLVSTIYQIALLSLPEMTIERQYSTKLFSPHMVQPFVTLYQRYGHQHHQDLVRYILLRLSVHLLLLSKYLHQDVFPVQL